MGGDSFSLAMSDVNVLLDPVHNSMKAFFGDINPFSEPVSAAGAQRAIELIQEILMRAADAERLASDAAYSRVALAHIAYLSGLYWQVGSKKMRQWSIFQEYDIIRTTKSVIEGYSENVDRPIFKQLGTSID